MGKDKIRRFEENATFRCVVQPEFEEIFRKDYRLKGRWREDFFGNPNPIVLELGCGRGEYTVSLAERFSDRNFIGVDIKGARLWRGAKTATENAMPNVAFLRTRIEFIDSFFAPGEVDEIWITFPDPQLRKNRVKKRLTAPLFLERYARFLKPGGAIHLKTDSQHLHAYTKAVAEANAIPCCRSGPPTRAVFWPRGCRSPICVSVWAAGPVSRPLRSLPTRNSVSGKGDFPLFLFLMNGIGVPSPDRRSLHFVP